MDLQMKLYILDDGEIWWYVADSKEDLIRQHLDHLVGDIPDEFQTLEEKLEFHLSVKLEDLYILEMQPTDKLSLNNSYTGELVEKTAKEWVESEGRGLIAGSVYD